MAGVGEDTVLIGDGGVTADEVRELVGTPIPEEDPKAGEGEEGSGGEEDHGDDEERSGRVDEELEGAGTDAEREAIRARRREERANKRLRAKDRVNTLERKLADERAQRIKMQKQLDDIHRTNQSSQVAQLETAVAQSEHVIAQLEAAQAAAVTANDGARAVEASRKITEVREYRQKMVNAKEQAELQMRRPKQEHLDPVIAENAQKFRQENPWFKGVSSNDEHSRIIGSIDAQLSAEGWDPASPSYWEELKTRGAKYLPDRFKKSVPSGSGGSYNAPNEERSQGKPAGRSPVAGGSNGASGASGGGRQSVTVSAARVQAIKDAGRWDNPTERAAMIKSYQDYDKRNGIK